MIESDGIATSLDLEPLAWVFGDDRLFFSRMPVMPVSPVMPVMKAPPRVPSSALIKLLQGIFDRYEDHSFFLLRRRIFTNYKINATEREMVRVVAKRVSDQQEVPKELQLSLYSKSSDLREWKFSDLGGSGTEVNDSEVCGLEVHGPKISFEEIENSESLFAEIRRPLLNLTLTVHGLTSDIATLMETLEDQIPSSERLHDQARKVVALCTDSDGRILHMTANNAIYNKTLHAEVLLVQQMFQLGYKEFPIDSNILISLKPCRMCAAMIRHFLPDGFRGKILFLRDDPGVLARSTQLDGLNFFSQMR